jgi:hypothetical protein
MDEELSGNPSTAEAGSRGTRWQQIAIDQLGYALNLILTFTIAALGYCFVLLKDKDFTPGSSAKCTLLLSLSAFAVSAICAMVCVVTRLLDFRGSARRARTRRARKGPNAPERQTLRILGRITWVCFWVQVSTFALGAAALAATLLLTYGGKLV